MPGTSPDLSFQRFSDPNPIAYGVEGGDYARTDSKESLDKARAAAYAGLLSKQWGLDRKKALSIIMNDIGLPEVDKLLRDPADTDDVEGNLELLKQKYLDIVKVKKYRYGQEPMYLPNEQEGEE